MEFSFFVNRRIAEYLGTTLDIVNCSLRLVDTGYDPTNFISCSDGVHEQVLEPIHTPVS